MSSPVLAFVGTFVGGEGRFDRNGEDELADI